MHKEGNISESENACPCDRAKADLRALIHEHYALVRRLDFEEPGREGGALGH